MTETAKFESFKLGVLDVIDIQYRRITVVLDGRTIDIPREPFCNNNGEWSTAYDLSGARFRDMSGFVPAKTAEIIAESLRLMHPEVPCIFE